MKCRGGRIDYDRCNSREVIQISQSSVAAHERAVKADRRVEVTLPAALCTVIVSVRHPTFVRRAQPELPLAESKDRAAAVLSG
jgi:hypothetical protein